VIDSGEYLIGNEKFSNIKTEKLLKNVSIVLQESEMFNLSLKENITLMHRFDKELFKKAIRIAQLEEVIDKMPKGIKTFIGEKGYHLSGGERQRVGIARAIYRNTQIMIFDEATSSLDSRTEKLIQEGIEREMEQKTLIFIAHRITTLKNVDNIYVFKNGRIVEDGKYDELLGKKEGEFYKLFKK
jgi:ABC-type multidrug transport system fused ATPase/permease subunit